MKLWFVLLALLPLPAAALTDEAALELFNRARGGNAAAFEQLQRAAEGGAAPAQFQLGRAYSHGASTKRDDALAAQWVEKAANQGHAEAQSNIGYLYSAGVGVPRDAEKAIAWWTRAAEGGFLQAQYNLAIAYVQGKLTAKDDAKAFHWMSKAAAQGNAAAQATLGDFHRRGTGTAPDMAQAAAWYRKAAEQGHSTSAYNLARLCRENAGLCERNPAPAHFVFEMTEPKLRVVIPEAPPMKMEPHPLAGAQPHARFMGGGPDGFTISVLTPTADAGMTAIQCANSVGNSVARRYGLKPESIVRRRNGDGTFVMLFAVRTDPMVQLKAYLMGAAGGTHCVEVHLSKTMSLDMAKKELEAWLSGFEGARLEAF